MIERLSCREMDVRQRARDGGAMPLGPCPSCLRELAGDSSCGRTCGCGPPKLSMAVGKEMTRMVEEARRDRRRRVR